MMFERHGLKVVGYSAIAPEDIAMFFQNYGIENNETYKELQKQRKARNGEYNLIKYARCHRHTRCEATMCPA
jgi:hypothetical protein